MNGFFYFIRFLKYYLLCPDPPELPPDPPELTPELSLEGDGELYEFEFELLEGDGELYELELLTGSLYELELLATFE